MNDRFRICGHAWTDKNGDIGSNHACGLEKGHVGEHDCLTCHATTAQPKEQKAS